MKCPLYAIIFGLTQSGIEDPSKKIVCIIYEMPLVCNNFWFNAIWHWRSMAALIFCRRKAARDVTVMPSVMGMNWLHWWFNHTAHVVSSSTAFVFLTNMSENHKSTSPVQSKWQIGERQQVSKRN